MGEGEAGQVTVHVLLSRVFPKAFLGHSFIQQEPGPSRVPPGPLLPITVVLNPLPGENLFSTSLTCALGGHMGRDLARLIHHLRALDLGVCNEQADEGAWLPS